MMKDTLSGIQTSYALFRYFARKSTTKGRFDKKPTAPGKSLVATNFPKNYGEQTVLFGQGCTVHKPTLFQSITDGESSSLKSR